MLELSLPCQVKCKKLWRRPVAKMRRIIEGPAATCNAFWQTIVPESTKKSGEAGERLDTDGAPGKRNTPCSRFIHM